MEKIEAYIQQKLKENERIEFENELSQNVELRNKVVSLKLINEVLQHYSTQYKINTLHKSLTANWLNTQPKPDIEIEEVLTPDEQTIEETSRSSNWLSKVLLALSILLLIKFGLFLFLIYKPITLPKFDERYTLLHDSQLAYYNENYTEALRAVEQAEATYTFSANDKAKADWLKTIVLAEMYPKATQQQLALTQKESPSTVSLLEKAQIWCKIGWLKLMGNKD